MSLSGKHPAQEHIYTGSMMATLFSLTTSCLAGRKQVLPASRLLVGNSHFTEGLSPGWITPRIARGVISSALTIARPFWLGFCRADFPRA